ncbi:cysteine protease family C01A [Achlya hypogyna]|uniref:Cysteine protease family C01A n=1 Tax=Achlya hypogyna TaxID=1202772 RepID=A0A0A7CN17_ACHHY|nr:secreted protein [Achlya hypogyna]OQS01193.1 cysteine protease family C01A [Achlya hypogyna]
MRSYSLVLCLIALVDVEGRNLTALQARFRKWVDSPAGRSAASGGFLRSKVTLERYFNAKLRSRALAALNPLADFAVTPFALLSTSEFASYVNPAMEFALNDSSISDVGFSSDWTIVDDAGGAWGIEVHDDRSKDPVVAPTKVLGKPARRADVDYVIDHSQGKCLTAPRNQGRCGDCWAFAATSAIEGAYCIATNNSITLSEQQMTNCNTKSKGCGGGVVSQAINFARGGLCKLSDVPFTLGTKGIATNCTACDLVNLGIAAVGKVTPTVEAFKTALAKSPIAVSLSAGNPIWQFYTGGIVTRGVAPTARIDHAVSIVGYGFSKGALVWKIRNSWGTGWGDGGYLHLAATTSANYTDGLFHVLSQGYVPIFR